jgi:uncharacterized membrane protein
MDNNSDQNPEEKKEAPVETVTPTTTATPVPATTPAPAADQPTTSFDFSQHTLIAAASYLGPLVIIPFLTNKDDPFTKFHMKQGLVVFVAYLILYVFGGFMYFLWPIISLINLGLFILSLIGIVYTLQRKQKELPLLGQFASHIKI